MNKYILIHNTHYNTTIWYRKITNHVELKEVCNRFLIFCDYEVVAKRLLEFGAIYLNRNRGWCVPMGSDVVLLEVTAQDFPTAG